MSFRQADKVVARLEKDYQKALTLAYQSTLKDINAKLKDVYAKYGEDGKLAYSTMSVADKNKVTRLQKVIAEVNQDLNALNRGRPQQLAGMLTEAYEVNYDVPREYVKAKVGATFDGINRAQVFQSAISEMGKIGLEQNAFAVRMAIRRDITTSIVQGDGIREMSAKIKKSLEGNANDTVRIARTETTRIVNEARQNAFTAAEGLGIVMRKMWLATSDGRTRPSHQALNGQEVDSDKTFSNGLLHPGQDGAPAKEVVNCRCTMVSRVVSIDGVPVDDLLN